MRIEPDLKRRWRELLTRYLDKPAGSKDRLKLNEELTICENKLLLPGRRGLVTPDEVRAKATPEALKRLHELEMPKVGRIRDLHKPTAVREWADRLQQKKRVEAITPGLGALTLNQGSNGSCGSEGASGGTMETQRTQGNRLVEKLNALALYRLVNSGYDGGSSLSDNMAAILKHGVPTERVWSRSHGWRTEPSDEAKQDALRNRPDEVHRVSDREEFGDALLDEFAVYFGYRGHAIFGFELIDDLRFWYQNSHGRDFGQDGAASISFSAIYWNYGAWAFRTARRPSLN